MKWQSYEPGRHLSPDELCPPEERCPICGQTGPRERRQVIQAEPEISLLLCPRCFGLSASRMPKRDVLDELYSSYYSDHEGERVIFQNPDRLARHILAMTMPVAPRTHAFRILDFGGGDGAIALSAARLVAERTRDPVEVQVVDYGDHVGATDGAIRLRYWHEIQDAAEANDLVIASGVFEHVPDLATILPALVEKMRPGGALYARTAHILPLMKLFSVDMNYPAHVHDLGDEFWGRLPQWLPVQVEIVRSQPSIVESDLRRSPVRTVAAYCMKFPARIESLWTRHPFYKLYGGWEVVLRRKLADGPERELVR